MSIYLFGRKIEQERREAQKERGNLRQTLLSEHGAETKSWSLKHLSHRGTSALLFLMKIKVFLSPKQQQTNPASANVTSRTTMLYVSKLRNQHWY